MYCSFCGKEQAETTKLIAGPGVNICESCVIVCKTIIDRQNAKDEVAPFTPTGMTLAQFKVGSEFLTLSGRWICTDKGKRTVVAMRLASRDGVRPPLSVAEVEVVFDGDDFGGCSPVRTAIKATKTAAPKTKQPSR